MTISIDEIIKESIYRKSQGEDISTENILSEALKGISKKELVNIYKENELFLNSKWTKQEMIERLEGACNRRIGALIMMTVEIKGESLQDFYKRIYTRQYL